MYSKLARGQILRSTLIVVPAGVAIFAGRLYWRGDESLFTKVFMPAVHKCVDAEYAHRLGLLQARYKLYPPSGPSHQDYDSLRTTVFGTEFRSPIGLAAGFDKDCSSLPGLCGCGFGFVELGTVTALPQLGNDKPRVFRLPEDQAVINRYGFNNVGIGRFIIKLENDHQTAACADTVIGVNIGKNRDTPQEDAQYNYASLMGYLGDKCNYVVVNVSSPNTRGLRDLQSSKSLKRILSEVRASRNRLSLQTEKSDAALSGKPVHRRGHAPPALLVKLSPDLTDAQLADVCAVCTHKDTAVDGIIMGNTTTQRSDTLRSELKSQLGGLSGEPLKQMSTEKIRKVYSLTGGRVPIIGCGGVSSGQDAYDKVRAGASLVQLYTSLVYYGWPVVGKVKRELNELILRDGFESVGQAVGADHRKM